MRSGRPSSSPTNVAGESPSCARRCRMTSASRAISRRFTARLPAARGGPLEHRSGADAGTLAAGRRREQKNAAYPGLPRSPRRTRRTSSPRGEIAELWRRITSRRLLAVIGASGAGKSRCCAPGSCQGAPLAGGGGKPGEDPLLAVARALARPVDDPEEMKRLLASTTRHGAGGGGAVAWAVGRGAARRRSVRGALHPQPGAGAERFAELLRRLVDAAGIHVGWCCATTPARLPPPRQLEPIFSDLTLLVHCRRELARALTEPAARRLYGFESTSMVDEMVAQVEAERGRCRCSRSRCRGCGSCGRDHRLLTREAYGGRRRRWALASTRRRRGGDREERVPSAELSATW